MEGSHSPFGLIWQLATTTGYSIHYLLWKINYTTLTMMLADAPKLVDKKHKRKGKKALEFFQTKLNNTDNE
ncbi:MAG: hypothetical protein ACRDDZ_06195 [Marinifilaceae bacterium]